MQAGTQQHDATTNKATCAPNLGARFSLLSQKHIPKAAAANTLENAVVRVDLATWRVPLTSAVATRVAHTRTHAMLSTWLHVLGQAAPNVTQQGRVKLH